MVKHDHCSDHHHLFIFPSAGSEGTPPLKAALAAFGKAYRKRPDTRKLSKSGRARIVAVQRAGWAKVRKPAQIVPIRGKRTLSAAARRKITAAQRARWAKVKAGKKTA